MSTMEELLKENARLKAEAKAAKSKPVNIQGNKGRVSGSEFKEQAKEKLDTILSVLGMKAYEDKGGDKDWNRLREMIMAQPLNPVQKRRMMYYDNLEARMRNISGLVTLAREVAEQSGYFEGIDILDTALNYMIDNRENTKFIDTTKATLTYDPTKMLPGNMTRDQEAEMWEVLANEANNTGAEYGASTVQIQEMMKRKGLVVGLLYGGVKYGKSTVDMLFRQIGVREQASSVGLEAGAFYAGPAALKGVGKLGKWGAKLYKIRKQIKIAKATGNLVKAAKLTKQAETIAKTAKAAGEIVKDTNKAIKIAQTASKGRSAAARTASYYASAHPGGFATSEALTGISGIGVGVGHSIMNYFNNPLQNALDHIGETGVRELALIDDYTTKVVKTDKEILGQKFKVLKHKTRNNVLSDADTIANISRLIQTKAALFYVSDPTIKAGINSKIAKADKILINKLDEKDYIDDAGLALDAINEQNNWNTRTADLRAERIKKNKQEYEDRRKIVDSHIKKVNATGGNKVRQIDYNFPENLFSREPEEFDKLMDDFERKTDSYVYEKELLDKGISPSKATSIGNLFYEMKLDEKGINKLIDRIPQGTEDKDVDDYVTNALSVKNYNDKKNEREKNIKNYLLHGDETSLQKLDPKDQLYYRGLEKKIQMTKRNLEQFETIKLKDGTSQIINRSNGKVVNDKTLSQMTGVMDFELRGFGGMNKLSDIIPEFETGIELRTDIRHAIAARHKTGGYIGAEKQYQLKQKKIDEDNTRWMSTAKFVNDRIRKAIKEGRDSVGLYNEILSNIETRGGSNGTKDREAFDMLYKSRFGTVREHRAFLKKPKTEPNLTPTNKIIQEQPGSVKVPTTDEINVATKTNNSMEEMILAKKKNNTQNGI